MELCSNGHGEVCYETDECPACEIINNLEEEVAGLEDDIANLQNELYE